MTQLDHAFVAIDAANTHDPKLEDGTPANLLYGQRMTAEQQRLFPDADDILRIACRGQHIERWTLPRDTYPMGRPGYLKWRQEQGRRHAERIAGIMADAGYGDDAIDRARKMLTKQGIKRDPQVQALEDVICFTFIRWYLGDFMAELPDEKMPRIIEKTARKMSADARTRALQEFEMPPAFADLFRQADQARTLSRAIIVSHGQPGDPAPQQQAIEDLAAQVATHLPGLQVLGATLAMPEALAKTCTGDSIIYPMFMAEGWFTGTELPRRLTAAGAPGAHIMRPFGTDPGLPALIVEKVAQAVREQGWDLADTTLMLSAHGSQRSQASFDITTALAETLAPHFAQVVTGFVEQEPFIADAAKGLDRAVSLPLFALRAEHVTDDLPQALDQAGFNGPRLDPIGLSTEAPAMIAQSIRSEVSNLK
jgi:sirohydrochlorin ferrochelatase